MKTGIDLIAEERQRQIEVEGWTPEHDTAYKLDELARAGASYALPEWERKYYHGQAPITFPFPNSWWKPTPNDRIRELAKAGALIAAEIDRLTSGDSRL